MLSRLPLFVFWSRQAMNVASPKSLPLAERTAQYYGLLLLRVMQRVETTACKHKVKTITAAVALTTLFYVARKVLRPPKALRQLPYIGFFEYIGARISKTKTTEDVARLHTLPAALKTDEGLYVVSSTEHLWSRVPETALLIILLMRTSRLSLRSTGQCISLIHAGQKSTCSRQVNLTGDVKQRVLIILA